MSDSITPRDAQFFYDHAGYSHDPRTETEEQGHRRCAAELAMAHALLAEAVDAGAVIVHWDIDEYRDDDVDYDNVEVMTCAIEADGDFLAALAGIHLDRWASGRDPYCDVIEAELALEAESELREILGARLEEQLRAND